jgi:hypothetical protein
MHRASAWLSIHASAIDKKDAQNSFTRRRTDQEPEYLHFITFPRFSISPRWKFSASAASEALERATSTFAVTIFSSCCAHLSWSRKDWIKESSLEEGARLSAVEEELPTVSYETGQASDPAEVPCKWGARSQIAIHKSKRDQA